MARAAEMSIAALRRDRRPRLAGVRLLLAAAAVFLATLACHFFWIPGPAQVTVGEQRRRRLQTRLDREEKQHSPGAILAGANALRAFRTELPHRFHGAVTRLLQHLQVPADPAAAHRLAQLRRELLSIQPVAGPTREGIVQAGLAKPGSKWQDWLQETCYVLGFDLVEQKTSPRLSAHGFSSKIRAMKSRQQRQTPLCPELWVDTAWPPTSLEHGADASQGKPVWSMPGTLSTESEDGLVTPGMRGIVVLQAKLLAEFPEPEIKALMGHELGRDMWAKLPTSMPREWFERVAQLYMAFRVYQQLQLAVAPPRPMSDSWLPSWLSPGSSGSFGWEGFFDDLAGSGQGGGFSSMVRSGFDQAVPAPLRPFAQGLFAGGASRPPPKPSAWMTLRHLLGPVAPALTLAAEAGALRGVAVTMAVHSRSAEITADRVAALAAGDENAAAASILRLKGLLPDSATIDVAESVRLVALGARQETWDGRRDVFMQASNEPAVEVRLNELLKWAHSASARRLMALADLRRSFYRDASASWRTRLSGLWDRIVCGGAKLPSGFWADYCGHMVFFAVFLMPVFISIDRIRWSAICTLIVTICGFLAPFFFAGAGMPMPLSLAVAGALAVYAFSIWAIWWNHLLGGARQWAQLSSRLTGQLSEQADITAGIAYLTHDWADMARRSLKALDLELCGSWRSNLSQLASALLDLQKELAMGPELPKSTAPTTSHTPTRASFAGNARSSRSSLSELAGRGPMGTMAHLGQAMVAAAGRPSSSSNVAAQGIVARTYRNRPNGFQAADRDDQQGETLCVKVDSTIQRVLRVEVERMKLALETNDRGTLQSTMAWWSPSIGDPYHGWCSGADSKNDGLTLGKLFLADQLQTRFCYPGSFVTEEVPQQCEVQEGAEEFERLERALSANVQSVHRLRSRLVPMEKQVGGMRCPRKADLRRACDEMRRVVQLCAGLEGGRQESDLPDTPEDRAAERRTLGSLAAAVIGGAAVTLLCVPLCSLLWLMAAAGFSVANVILLTNHWRLSLPYVHRRIERRLVDLSDGREQILEEIKGLQGTLQMAGIQHMKATIFLQSVNVLRNITYMVMCIKKEAGQAEAVAPSFGVDPQAAHSKVVKRGLQLLLACLPREEPRWRQEILADEDCGRAACLLQWQANSRNASREAEQTSQPQSWPCLLNAPGAMASASAAARKEMQDSIVDAQKKRLGIFFRMVHLASEVPSEAQGRMYALLQQYLRPIVLEGRVPLQGSGSILEPQGVGDLRTDGAPSLEDAKSRQSSSQAGPASSGDRFDQPARQGAKISQANSKRLVALVDR
eukprot:TRINITY_DN100684_c0_g1_i1.p1 TRINITY_DN100684_c0_g1~~TRINITY_DN100684_c0_g1_i1.p1  ORF type:complete len:1310 (-),score=269.55 TRINITY_DN100684_c0_g1_i1:17-3946(-)